MRALALLATLIAVVPAEAQTDQAQGACQPPRPTTTRNAAPALRPEVNVLCGSNSVTQTFASPPAASEVSATTPTSSNATTTHLSTLAAVISGAAGVLGAFAGAIASYLVARAKAKSDLELESKRLSANLIATERLRWLQDIRQRLATFYQQLDMQYSHLKRPSSPTQQNSTQELLDNFSSEVMAQCNMITLMLNPAKPDQAALRDTLQSALAFMQRSFGLPTAEPAAFNDAEYAKYKQAAFDAMTRIGIETWKQVKSLQ